MMYKAKDVVVIRKDLTMKPSVEGGFISSAEIKAGGQHVEIIDVQTSVSGGEYYVADGAETLYLTDEMIDHPATARLAPPAIIKPEDAIEKSTYVVRAEQALETAHYDEPGTPSELVDVLTDLIHLARDRGIDFEDACRIAHYHAQAEEEE